VPYWEWSGCEGAGEREQYLKSKLAECEPAGAQCKAQGKGGEGACPGNPKPFYGRAPIRASGRQGTVTTAAGAL